METTDLLVNSIVKAGQRYKQLKGDARWSETDLNEIATTASLEQRLNIFGDEVLPEIVRAVRASAEGTMTPEILKKAAESFEKNM